MADAQLRHLAVHGLEPVVQALAGTHVRRQDDLGHVRGDQLGQPFVDGGEVALFQQRRRVGLEQGVLEQQRHHVLQGVDAFHRLTVGELLQHRDVIAQCLEALAQAGQLQGIQLGAGQPAPGTVVMVGEGCRVVEQQVLFLFW
ncbi:hypothetical protein FQZ97_940120 [compost metagenome]